MTKLRQDPQYRHGLYLLAFLLVCAAEIARAQDSAAPPGELPVIVDRKQADSLVMAQTPPDYPPIAKVNLIQGQVQLELTVNGKGKVTRSHVLKGNAILAEAALKATLRWLYHPLTTPAGPSGFITTVRLKYTLNYRGTDLTPQQAERDFMRQVKPPQAVPPPDDGHSADLVHVRLLINEQGQVVDMEVSPTEHDKAAAAREILRGWTFLPAHWGSLPIASYLDVNVPVHAPAIASAGAGVVRQ